MTRVSAGRGAHGGHKGVLHLASMSREPSSGKEDLSWDVNAKWKWTMPMGFGKIMFLRDRTEHRSGASMRHSNGGVEQAVRVQRRRLHWRQMGSHRLCPWSGLGFIRADKESLSPLLQVSQLRLCQGGVWHLSPILLAHQKPHCCWFIFSSSSQAPTTF